MSIDVWLPPPFSRVLVGVICVSGLINTLTLASPLFMLQRYDRVLVSRSVPTFVERRMAAEDQLKRIGLLAPQDGAVHGLTIHTVGGVVGAGDIVMSIVPDHETLALEAQIAPQDIDQVQIDQTALLRLSAFNQRATLELGGAGDASGGFDPGSAHGPFLLSRTRSVPTVELARLNGQKLISGMSAEVFIQTGLRTALSFFIKPLSDQVERYFRED